MNDKYFVSYAYFGKDEKQVFGNAIFEVPKGQETLETIKAVEEQLAAIKKSEVIIIFFHKCQEPGRLVAFNGRV